MTDHFTQKSVDQYYRNGFTPSFRVLSVEQAIAYRNKLEAVEAVLGELTGGRRFKCHLLYKWVSELIREPRILDAVEKILGPNILCWGTDFWLKNARSDKFVSWHQDSEYWGIDNDRLITAWVALSPATVESGCMRMLPGSHLQPGLEHEDTFHPDNMLTRGQTISNGINEEDAVNIEVDTGETVLFAYRIAHASHPNKSDDRRIGIAIRYISPEARQVKSDWDTASLVRGEDNTGHFSHEPVPEFNFDPVTVEFHTRATENLREILYSGTGLTEHRT